MPRCDPAIAMDTWRGGELEGEGSVKSTEASLQDAPNLQRATDGIASVDISFTPCKDECKSAKVTRNKRGRSKNPKNDSDDDTPQKVARKSRNDDVGTTHSVYDIQALGEAVENLETAGPDALEEYPNALKSFEKWMSRGASAKSARNYVHMISLLMSKHGKSIRAMQNKDYHKWVSTSSENRKRNNMIGAALKQFQSFIAMRGNADSPWEEHALKSETCYRVDRTRRTQDYQCRPRKEHTTLNATPSDIDQSKSGQQVPTHQGSLSKEQMKRIAENRRAAMQRRQQSWIRMHQQIAPEEMPRNAAEQHDECSKTKLSAEQIMQIEANRQAALQKRQQRALQEHQQRDATLS